MCVGCVGCVEKANNIVALEGELKSQRDLASGIVFDLRCELEAEQAHGITIGNELDSMTSMLSDSKLEIGEMVKRFAEFEKKYVVCVKEKEEKILQHSVLNKRVDALRVLLKRTNEEVYRLRQFKCGFFHLIQSANRHVLSYFTQFTLCFSLRGIGWSDGRCHRC